MRVFVGGTTTIGAVSAVSDEGFELLGDGRRQSFAYGTIYRLEQSLGTRSLWKRGWRTGPAPGSGQEFSWASSMEARVMRSHWAPFAESAPKALLENRGRCETGIGTGKDSKVGTILGVHKGYGTWR